MQTASVAFYNSRQDGYSTNQLTDNGLHMARALALNQEQWIEMARHAEYRAGSLSQKLGISQRQLERIMGKRFGLSPQSWLDEQRMLRAVVMLKEKRSVKSIAFDLGFKWVSHFCLKFKKHHQHTPTAFLASVGSSMVAATKPLLPKDVRVIRKKAVFVPVRSQSQSTCSQMHSGRNVSHLF